MKKWEVMVTVSYQMTFEVEAEDEDGAVEAAEFEALNRGPKDDGYFEVEYVEEIK